MKQGWDANKILSESVVQLQKTDEESFELKIRPGETHMFDNNPFRDDVTEEEYRAANRAAKMKDDVMMSQGSLALEKLKIKTLCDAAHTKTIVRHTIFPGSDKPVFNSHVH